MADAIFTAVDLSQLPAPDLIEALDFDTLYARGVAFYQTLDPDFEPADSKPVSKLLQVYAYREFMLRQRINDAGRAVMPASAAGADLDNIAARFGIVRLVITPADPVSGTPAEMESDTDFRRRMVLAPEGYSVAGPEGAYYFLALSADADVLDASATSPAPGEVLISLLSRTGNGHAPDALVAKILAYLSAETRRPLTDHVTVRSAELVEYSIDYDATTYNGPDGGIVFAASKAAVEAYAAKSRRLGIDITRSAIFAAAHVPGIQNIVLRSPREDIAISRTQAPLCVAISAAHMGSGE